MGFEFEKLEENKKPLHVANQILEAMRCGDYEKGDKLPTEEELAEKTGVSRASVREALSALRLGGIINTKVGKGTFVKRLPLTDSLGDQILDILVDNPKPLELQEARAAFEAGVVEVAARKCSEEDEKSMDETLDDMKSAAKKDDYRSFLNLHKRFHLQVAKATRNKVIEDTIKNLQGIMNDRMWQNLEEMHYLPDKRNYLLESYNIHYKLFEALVDRDPSLARERIKDHFERYS
ncbi:FadR family transcriptional regulator [Candidatus Bipolaricaulota bacterium]|nr:FadR family transcriptional regulator [Candidatus Bipolaricaulota bacterium]